MWWICSHKNQYDATIQLGSAEYLIDDCMNFLLIGSSHGTTIDTLQICSQPSKLIWDELDLGKNWDQKPNVNVFNLNNSHF